MEEAIADFYQTLEDNGLPIHYSHSQSDSMPENQWMYNDVLTAMCGPDLELLPSWRRELHSVGQSAIFGRPETFRDQWTEGKIYPTSPPILPPHGKHANLM
jgi:hypothetical protein